MKKNKINNAARQALENLETRQLMSSILLNGTALELHGDSGQSNTFVVRSASDNRVIGYADNQGEVASLTTCNKVVVYTGDKSDTVTVDSDVTTPVEVISASGNTSMVAAGTTQTFNPTTGSSGGAAAGSGDSSGGDSSSGDTGSGHHRHHRHQGQNGTTGTGGSTVGGGIGGDSGSSGGASTTGSGASSTGSGSSSTGAGTSSTGLGSSSTGSGASSTGSGSSSTGSGSSSTGSGSSSTGLGSSSTGSGTSSTGSGSSSTGSGSSTTGSGTSSTGSGSSSTGSGSSSTGTGSGSSGTGSSTPSNPNDPGTPSPVITVTSASTILPNETVNVQALKSSFGNGTQLSSTIAWNFGDATGTYNTVEGFNAAHAYANAGTYTITLTVTTPDGHVGIATKTVTVAADTRKTIYVSANGSDSNNGSSSSQAIQSIARLSQLITSNTRVLFEDGGTYDMKSNINLDGLQHVFIGSYGSGAKPIIMCDSGSVGSMIGLNSTSQGIVVEGLTFDSTGNAPDGADIGGNGIAFINNTFYNLTDDFNLNQNPTNVLIQGNTSPSKQDLEGYFAWVQGTELAIMGNTVANSQDQAIIRTDQSGTTGGDACSDLDIAYNNFTITSTDGKNTMTLMWSYNTTVFDNTVTGGPIQTGPLGDVPGSGATSNAELVNTVIDSNTIYNNVIRINPQTLGLRVSNNVINPGSTYGIWINSTESFGSTTWQVQNVSIVNNTVTSTNEDSGFLYVDSGEALNVTVDNNVFVDPNLVIGDNQSAYIWDANGDLSTFTQIQDNVWGTPGSEYSWESGGEFVIGNGQTTQSAWITPGKWETIKLSGGGHATNDVYEDVSLGSTYSVKVDGFTAGSSLTKAA